MVTPAEPKRIEAMWIHLVLILAVLYVVIITVTYFAQTWILFPAPLARATRIRLPALTQRLEVRTPDGRKTRWRANPI